jgi:group I intron endonuclease
MEKPIYGLIYKLINLRNAKVYIGQTINTPETRIKDHFKSSGRGATSLIGRALRKWGRDNFKVEVIDTALTLDWLNQKEESWIAYYDSCNKEKGYNIAAGGAGTKCVRISEAQKEYLRQLNTGKTMSLAVKEKISIACRAFWTSKQRQRQRQFKLGRKASLETREKIKIAAKRIYEENPEKRQQLNFVKGSRHTLETKSRLSAASIGHKASLETRLKMSRAHMGKVPNWSAEARAKVIFNISRMRDKMLRAGKVVHCNV